MRGALLCIVLMLPWMLGNTIIHRRVAGGAPAIVHGAALDLNGTDEALRDTVTNRAYGIANAFTVAAWVKADTATASMCVFQLNPNTGDNDGTKIQVDGASANDPIRVIVVDGDGDAKNYTYDSLLTTGSWHHLAYTWDGTTLTFYFNGSAQTPTGTTSDASGVVLTDNANRRIQVGFNRTSGDYWDGRLHSLALWSVVLDATEISTIYNAGEGGEMDYSDVEGASLQHWWQIGKEGDIGGDFGVHADPVDITTNATNITEGDDRVVDYPGL